MKLLQNLLNYIPPIYKLQVEMILVCRSSYVIRFQHSRSPYVLHRLIGVRVCQVREVRHRHLSQDTSRTNLTNTNFIIADSLDLDICF